MIKSMTGYGRVIDTVSDLEITCEMKAVNHRYFEVNVRAPRQYLFLEELIKKEIKNYISRGKIDVFLTVVDKNALNVAVVNEELIRAYVTKLRALSESDLNIADDLTLSSVARLPDVFKMEKEAVADEEIIGIIMPIVKKTAENFNLMREAEGQKLYDDVMSRIDTIEKNVKIIEDRSEEIVKAYSKRLYDKIEETLQNANIDEQRILTEVAIFSDRVATNEEVTRLYSHIDQFRNILNLSEPVGKKLDFLVQEFNRETNTIGSKCQDVATTNIVIENKSEIEKIREQIQNIE